MTRSGKLSNQNLLVRASAGSGKTFQLTNRYIQCLIQGEAPSGLLATTFTRVAAGEILHRVLLRLSLAMFDDNSLKELRSALELPTLTTEQCAQALQRTVHDFHRLSVMTIDSLFSRMTTAFAPELGLPSAFRMIPEDENQQLREQCIDDAIQQCSVPEMYTLLRALQGQRVQMNTHAAITKLTDDAYATYLASNGSKAPWHAIDPVGTPLNNEHLHSYLPPLQRVTLPATKSGAPDKRWSKAMLRAIDCVETHDWESLLGSGLCSKILEAHCTDQTPEYYGKPQPQELIDTLTPYIEHAKYILTNEHIESTHATYGIMRRFDQSYRSTKMSTGQLSFEDPPRLLQEASITGDLEHLYYRLDASIRHVMLDEFQDTSIPQFNLIEPILHEILSQNEEGRSAFIVGDAKQSLYSWRQAEPKLLGAVKDHWDTLDEEPLSKSWRSSPIILDTVNAVFESLEHNAALTNHPVGLSAAQSWDEQYDHHAAAKEHLPGLAQLIVAQSDPDQEPDPTHEVLWECAARVAEARAQCPNASVAVLMRQGKNIYPMLSMLKKLGVDACEDRGNPLVDAPPVAALVSLLQLIDHPSNSAALHHVLTSPLAGFLRLANESQIHSIAMELRKRISAQGCVPLLMDILRECGLSMDQRGFTRFEQCIELAAQLEAEGRGGAAVLAQVAQSRRIDDPGQATVRVITIHRSKGLEFDCVVLPLLGSTWNLKPNSLLTARENQLGPISHITKYPNNVLRAIHPVLDSIYSHSMARQINEELCCLYVGMTRAKHALQLIIPSTKDGRAGNPEKKPSLKPAHVIHTALAQGTPSQPGEIIYELSTDLPWFEFINNEKSKAQQTTKVSSDFKLKPASLLKTGLLESAAPSMIKNPQKIHSAELLTATQPTTSALEFGEDVHSAFELFDWIPDSASETWIQDQLTSQESPAFEDGVTIEVSRTLNAADIRNLYTEKLWLKDHPGSTTVSVYHERPFATRNQSNTQLIQGRIDRLVIGRSNDAVQCAQIIDFKTDRAAAGLNTTELKDYAQRHSAQMIAYQEVISRMYTLDRSAVELILIYTANPQVVRL